MTSLNEQRDPLERKGLAQKDREEDRDDIVRSEVEVTEHTHEPIMVILDHHRKVSPVSHDPHRREREIRRLL